MRLPPSERFIWKSILKVVGSTIFLLLGISVAIEVFNTSAALMPTLAVLILLVSFIPLVLEVRHIIRRVYFGMNDFND